MTRPWRWFLAVIIGLMLTLGGLLWDAVIHSQQHGHVEESLLNLTNPGHPVFGLGLVLTTLVALGGFTTSWLSEHPTSILGRRVAVPAFLWIVIGLAGAITLAALSRTGLAGEPCLA